MVTNSVGLILLIVNSRPVSLNVIVVPVADDEKEKLPETSDNSDGKVSMSVMLVATSSKSRFSTVTVNSTVVPILTKNGSERLDILRSNAGTLNEPASVSFPVFVSIMLDDMIVATFTTVPLAIPLTVTVNVRVTVWSTRMPEIFHNPETES